MIKIRRYLYVVLCLLLLSALLVGCKGNTGAGGLKGSAGGSGLKPVQPDTETEEPEELEKVYILKEVNLSECTVVLLKVGGSYREYTYKYTGGTVMMDRYGKNIPAAALECGEVFVIELNNSGETLKSLKESTQVWTFDDVSQFTLDQENEILKVNGENYHLSDATMVFSGAEMWTRYRLSEKDVINLIGYEKELVSIIVETAHGTLAFSNTEEFRGGYYVLGNIMAGQITEDMRVEVPAGDYSLSVAYKGNGGNTPVTITPGETTVIDLSEFEAEAKKTCQVTIKPAQEGMVVKINGEEIDTTKTFTLEYGLYRITATLDGYDVWSRLLMISSPEAAFVIDLTNQPSGGDKEEDQEDNKEDGKEEDTEDNKDEDTDEDKDEEESDDDGWTDNFINDVLDSLFG